MIERTYELLSAKELRAELETTKKHPKLTRRQKQSLSRKQWKELKGLLAFGAFWKNIER